MYNTKELIIHFPIFSITPRCIDMKYNNLIATLTGIILSSTNGRKFQIGEHNLTRYHRKIQSYHGDMTISYGYKMWVWYMSLNAIKVELFFIFYP